MRRVAVLALTTAAFVLAAAAPASAWWAEGNAYFNSTFGFAEVYAEPGEVNDLTVDSRPTAAAPLTPVDGSVLIRDASAPVTPPPAGRGHGCTQIDSHTMRCIAMGYAVGEFFEVSVTGLRVELGDGDDRVRVPLGESLFKVGDTGSGNDTVLGYDSAGADIWLGDGNDRITLRGSGGGYLPDDSVQGAAGDDVLRVFNGAADDNPICGEGQDVLYADAGESHESCEAQHHFP